MDMSTTSENHDNDDFLVFGESESWKLWVSHKAEWVYGAFAPFEAQNSSEMVPQSPPDDNTGIVLYPPIEPYRAK